MTLLPLEFGEHGLSNNKVNFISLTPGTTFNLRSSTGVSQERALLFHLLKDMVEPRRGLYNLLQVGAGVDRWKCTVKQTPFAKVDQKLINDFRSVCKKGALLDELAELCYLFRKKHSYPQTIVERRNRMVSQLRNSLARVCVDTLEPDVIILDEFQRFTELLNGNDDAAMLARDLFDYTDRDGNSARTLLLSATPYRMLTLSGDTEAEGDHYHEFLETLRFLFGQERGPAVVAELSRETNRFRRAMLSLPDATEEAREYKSSIEKRLQAVMERTERVASTRDRDAMVEESRLAVSVVPDDLRSATAVAKVARIAEAPDIVEYWKSAPYLLNFMRDYVLKRKIKAHDGKHAPVALLDAIRSARPSCLIRSRIQDYRPLKPPNGRMRLLMDEVFGDELEKHLWIPPSLPYYRVGSSQGIQASKSLVFSSWSMVPDAVAAVLSYEAERRMGVKKAGMGYFDRQRPRPLQFQVTQGRLAGLRALLLSLPLAVDCTGSRPARRCSGPFREHLPTKRCALSPDDAAATAFAAASARRESIRRGRYLAMGRSGGARHTRRTIVPASGLRKDDGFMLDSVRKRLLGADHIGALRDAVRERRVGGVVPDSRLMDLLVDLALGSPAICALRALRRVAPELDWDDPALLNAASRAAWGFRTLYNQHDTVALLRRESDDRYWHKRDYLCCA